MDFIRILKHLLTPAWRVRRALSGSALAELEAAIKAGEATHRGEVRLAIEAALNPWPLLRGQSARSRAVEVFSELRVWDTAENNGVLIYLLLADRRVEIVADRGLDQRVRAEDWTALCARLEQEFARGAFRQGLLDGVRAIHALLAQAFPAAGPNPNELPDQPRIIT